MKQYKKYINQLISEQFSGQELLKAIANYSMDWTYEYSDDHRYYTAGLGQKNKLQSMINDLVNKIRSNEIKDITEEDVENVLKDINKNFQGSTSVSIPPVPRDRNKEMFDQIKKVWPINGAKAEELMKKTNINTFAIKKADSKNEFLFLPKASQGEKVWRSVDSQNKMYPFRNPLPRLFIYVDNADLKDDEFEIVSSKIGGV